jgi:carbamoyl-phosphate synthase large subunit
MNVVYDESTLQHFLSAATNVSPDHPVVISQFIDEAQEIDVDAVAHKGKLLVHAVSEHVENAGVHSGDATLVLPPFSLPESDMDRFKEIAQKVAKAFDISGPFNMQIIRKPPVDGQPAELKVIECNLRASRSFPFVSKVLGKNFIDVASAAIMDTNVPEPIDLMKERRDYVAIKVPQFSWTRLPGADPFLGVGESVRNPQRFSLTSQRWHLLERSPPSVRTFTRPTGPLSCPSTVSSFLDLTRVSSSVVTSTDPRWPSLPPTSCD